MYSLKKTTMTWLVAGTLGATAFFAADQAVAQDETGAATPAPSGTINKEMTLLDYYMVGGWCMHPILLLSMAGVALVIRNYLVVREKIISRPDLAPSLIQAMAHRDVAAAREICEAHRCVLTRIVSAGLDRMVGEEVDTSTVTLAMEEAGTEQTATFMTPISYLSVIGTLAPMLGLLGTVSGMIGAFQTIASGGMGKPELLAGDIGEALITTFAGLTVAIPVMGYYFFFKNKFVKIMAGLARTTGQMMESFKTGQMPPSQLAQAAPPPAA